MFWRLALISSHIDTLLDKEVCSLSSTILFDSHLCYVHLYFVNISASFSEHTAYVKPMHKCTRFDSAGNVGSRFCTCCWCICCMCLCCLCAGSDPEGGARRRRRAAGMQIAKPQAGQLVCSRACDTLFSTTSLIRDLRLPLAHVTTYHI